MPPTLQKVSPFAAIIALVSLDAKQNLPRHKFSQSDGSCHDLSEKRMVLAGIAAVNEVAACQPSNT